MSIALAQKHNVPVGGAANNAAANAPKTKTWDDYVRELGSKWVFKPARDLKKLPAFGGKTTVYKGARFHTRREKGTTRDFVHREKLNNAHKELYEALAKKWGKEFAERAFADCGIEKGKITDKQLVKLDIYAKVRNGLRTKYGSDIADRVVRENDFGKGNITRKKIGKISSDASFYHGLRIKFGTEDTESVLRGFEIGKGGLTKKDKHKIEEPVRDLNIKTIRGDIENCIINTVPFSWDNLEKRMGHRFVNLAKKHFGKNVNKLNEFNRWVLYLAAKKYLYGAQNQLATESFLFLNKSVDLIDKIDSNSYNGKISELYKQIFDEFISSDSANSINISGRHRSMAQVLRQKIENEPDSVSNEEIKGVLDSCHKSIYSLVEKNENLDTEFKKMGGFEGLKFED